MGNCNEQMVLSVIRHPWSAFNIQRIGQIIRPCYIQMCVTEEKSWILTAQVSFMHSFSYFQFMFVPVLTGVVTFVLFVSGPAHILCLNVASGCKIILHFGWTFLSAACVWLQFLIRTFLFAFRLFNSLLVDPGSRGSSVSIVSDYGLDDRGSIRGRGRGFSSSPCIQTHLASCSMGTGGPFPGGKARPGRDADHSPPSSAEVKYE
jgi:hypothetical protein